METAYGQLADRTLFPEDERSGDARFLQVLARFENDPRWPLPVASARLIDQDKQVALKQFRAGISDKRVVGRVSAEVDTLLAYQQASSREDADFVARTAQTASRFAYLLLLQKNLRRERDAWARDCGAGLFVRMQESGTAGVWEA
jgi:uncharacterized membrane protein